jgi:hypothetical protein
MHFDARPEIIGDASGLIGATYLKVFDYDGYVYGMVMGGVMYRSKDGLTQWEMGPRVFPMGGGPVSDMRHHALLVRGDTLYVFWTRAGAAPELIQVSTIDLGKDWQTWKASAPVEVLRPERPWEGADMPVRPSIRSTAYDKVNQLRDPAVYEEGGRTYLFYAVAGESGIGLAELFFSK